MTYATPSMKKTNTQGPSEVSAVGAEFTPGASGQMTVSGQGVGDGFGLSPGSLVSPASTGRVSTQSSEAVRSSFLNTGSSPVFSDGQPRKRPISDCTPDAAEAEYVFALSPERQEFRDLYLSGRFAEARRLAERMSDVGTDRAAWVHNLASVASEQGNIREAYSLYLTHSHLLADCPDTEAAAKFNLSFGSVSRRLWLLHGVREFAIRAEKAYRDAARLYEDAGLPGKVAYALNNLGNLYVSAGEPHKAYEYLDTAQILFNDAGEYARCADVEDTRALAFEAEGKIGEAFECSSRAVSALARFGEAERKSFDAACETHARIFGKLKGGL